MSSLNLLRIDEKAKARFWSKVDRRGADECWPWTAAAGREGYGVFSVRLDSKVTHFVPSRVAWTDTYGLIPRGLMVCHKCDTPGCCNPRHLFVGTNHDNMRDMAEKGRSMAGERNCKAKLTERDVPLIRAAVASGESRTSVAARFGLHYSTVARISNRRYWKHVPPPGNTGDSTSARSGSSQN